MAKNDASRRHLRSQVKTALFDYELLPELIAVHPPRERNGGRMLTLTQAGVEHNWVRSFVDQLSPRDLLVLNETKVRKARLLCFRKKQNVEGRGGKVELLFLHPLGGNLWAALGKANRPLRAGSQLEAPGLLLEVVDRDADGVLSISVDGDLEAALAELGQMPIPPYLQRDSDAMDDSRYQTVFARELGSAAAPTAGLHLTSEMMTEIHNRGVRSAQVVLHVGVGTFRPVSCDDLDQHPMHSEQISVGVETRDAIAETRRRGGRVVAVGTTVVRALESARSATEDGQVVPTSMWTKLLIQPGYRFSVVDALLTNFHQPKSTLLALVSAFAGYERTMNAYRIALEERYRFLSYGDAMWLPQRLDAYEQKGAV